MALARQSVRQDRADMVDAPPRGDLHLFRPFQIAGAVGFGPAVGATVASDPLDIEGRGPSGFADRHAATPAETVVALRQAVSDRDPLVDVEPAVRLGA